MTTQKHNTLNPLTAKSAVKAPVSADRPVHAKAAAKQATKADLDKLAKTGIEQDIIVADAAEASVDAPIELAMSEGMDNPPGFGIGAVEGAAATEGTAALSPLAIGAGVLGVAAVAAIAGGGSSSGSKNNDNIQQKPPVDNDKKPGNDQPGGNNGKPPVGDTPTPGNGDPKPPAGEVKYGQATAQGEAAAPKVSPDGETKLTISKEAFTNKLTEAGVDANDTSKHFIRIDRIQASEMGGDHGSRMVRYPAEPSDASGIRVKAPADDKPTAYEVIKVEAGITLADAKAAAEKLGGKLMVVDNEAEANWLKAEFKNLLGSDQVGSGAWIGGSKLAGAAEFNAAVRNEEATDIAYSKAAGEKLTAYVVEFENYKHPLTLNGQPVAEGQVINAAEFDKLVWNGDGNTGGKISFSVVNSADATEAGTTKGDLTITESAEVKRPEISGNPGGSQQPAPGTDPAPGTGNGQGGSDSGSNQNPKPLPTYPEDNAQTANVETDKADATLSKALFTGTGHPAEYIKILSVTLPDVAAQETRKALTFENHDGQSSVQVPNGDGSNTTVHHSLFHKISWNASLANGGTIKFVPVADKDGNPLPGAKEQTITITETPAAPNPPAGPEYDQDALTVDVAHNGSHTFTADFFDGKANNVTHVKVSAAKDGTDNTPAAADGTLKFNGENVPADGKVIAVADANKLVWDANLAQGGSFTFVPVADAAGAELAGATEQTVTINEAAAPQPAPEVPTYGSDPLTAEVAHNKADFNFESHKAHFEGTGNTKATHIKITEIKDGAGAGDQAAAADTLKYNGQNVTSGTVIELTKLNLLVWDASKAEGGSFKFTPVQANGDAIANGPAAQSVTINEAAYVAEAETKEVAKNADTTLGKDLFDFSVEGKAEPGFVKITAITASADELAEKRVENPDTKTAYQVVKVGGDGITKAEAITAAEKMGGKLLEISNEAELNWIKGKPELMGKLMVEDSDATGKGFWFTNPTSGAVTGVTENAEGIKSSNGSGSEAKTLDFVDANPNDADSGKLSGYVVEFSNYDTAKQASLMLSGDSNKTSVAKDTVIDFNDIKADKLSWNSVFNNGGEVKFIEVTSKETTTPVEGAVEKTITINESATVDSLLEQHQVI